MEVLSSMTTFSSTTHTSYLNHIFSIETRRLLNQPLKDPKQPVERWLQLLCYLNWNFHIPRQLKLFLVASAEGLVIHIWNDRGTFSQDHVEAPQIHCKCKKPGTSMSVRLFTYRVCGRQDVRVPSENVPSLQSEHWESASGVPVQTQTIHSY